MFPALKYRRVVFLLTASFFFTVTAPRLAPLINAPESQEGVRVIRAHNETAVALMAEGYIRRSRLQAAAVFLIFFQPLSTSLTKHIIRQKMAQQVIKFDDGLHAVLCGTGSPMPDMERVGPCIAVIVGNHLYIVDAWGAAPETFFFPVFRPEKLTPSS